MIFETAIKITVVDKKGNDKVVTNRYIVENEELFGEAESKLYEEFGGVTGFEVASIKISKLREIINEAPQGDECKIYFATIVDKFVDDNENIKEIPYIIALFAHNMTEAKATVDQYMRQGLEDMELKKITETKVKNVLR